MKRNPKWEGKRSVGIVEKRRETVLAMPKAVPSIGAMKSAVRMAFGATRARTGRIAVLRVKGVVLWGVVMRSVERKLLNDEASWLNAGGP